VSRQVGGDPFDVEPDHPEVAVPVYDFRGLGVPIWVTLVGANVQVTLFPRLVDIAWKGPS
jgi:hypothetical protein